LTLPETADLTRLADQELLAIVSSLPHDSERRKAACTELVARYRGLVWSCVRRYRSGSESIEDLMQVGFVGLVKAINNFDPAFGRALAAYAEPCISGEIKRHFRDGYGQIHVARAVKELAAEIRAAIPRLAQDLGRTPSAPDLARYLRVSDGELREAQVAELAFAPMSLEAPLSARLGAGTLADLLGADDPRMEHTLGMQSVAAHWGELPAGRAADPAPSLLRRHDPGPDRPAAWHLADASLPPDRTRRRLSPPAPAQPVMPSVPTPFEVGTDEHAIPLTGNCSRPGGPAAIR
jgi:RNA polymerase sigma-B factor